MAPQPCPAAFAIPGDIDTLTGGYIYEKRLLLGLRARGHEVAHLRLEAGFPDPSAGAMADAVAQMQAVAPTRALIVDGLVFGSVDTAGLAAVRAPVVAMLHHPLALETGLTEARKAHLYRTERDNLTLARAVLVPSPHTSDILTSRYGVPPGRITIARPGVDPPAGLAAPTEPPLILSVGIRHPRKGHDVLLRALAGLTALDWRAVIVGGAHDPAHAAALDELRDGLGLRDRVEIAGQVSRDRLQALYRAASVFALATRYEGYGIVFDEALSHGLPIVSCATGAVPDTVPAGTGLLVPPDAPAEFAAALRRYLTDPDLRAEAAAAARQAGDALPGWDTTARIASEVLMRLAG